MAYRAHVTVHTLDRRHPRLGITALRQVFPAVAPNERFVREPAGTIRGTLIGTRYGAPGIWLERDSIDAFKAGLRLIVGATRAAGYEPQVWTTNAPSKVAAETALYGMKVPVARG